VKKAFIGTLSQNELKKLKERIEELEMLINEETNIVEKGRLRYLYRINVTIYYNDKKGKQTLFYKIREYDEDAIAPRINTKKYYHDLYVKGA